MSGRKGRRLESADVVRGFGTVRVLRDLDTGETLWPDGSPVIPPTPERDTSGDRFEEYGTHRNNDARTGQPITVRRNVETGETTIREEQA